MTSDRATRIAAAAVAIALNLMIVGVMSSLPVMSGIEVAEEAIQIRWIERTPERIREPAPTRVFERADFPKPTATPLRALNVSAARASTPIIAVEDDSWDTPASGKVEGFHPVASRRLFPRETIPSLERQTITTFAMQDSSTMAKIDRVSGAFLCNNLRMLARGSDLQLREHMMSREVILRTMQSQKCRF
jgi:hypothetical protein